jgi:hypothetical protein
MLSDSIRIMREGKEKKGSEAGEVLALRGFELEARNMEERLALLTGRPHAPLDGNLVSRPDVEVLQP